MKYKQISCIFELFDIFIQYFQTLIVVASDILIYDIIYYIFQMNEGQIICFINPLNFCLNLRMEILDIQYKYERELFRMKYLTDRKWESLTIFCMHTYFSVFSIARTSPPSTFSVVCLIHSFKNMTELRFWCLCYE